MKLDWRLLSLGDGPLISTSLTLSETAQLQLLAEKSDVLEVGSAYGYSAIAMALHGARVTAVDPHIWLDSRILMQDNVLAYGVADKVSIIADWSGNVLPKLTRKFPLIWIDGDHSEEAVTIDIQLSVPLLQEGGKLAFHDYDELTCPGVRIALDKLLGPPHQLVDTLALYFQDRIQWPS